ncbi:MAG: TonB-dependent receptor [Armatimonadota bacterium]|nr:MAG: TonB-dependent receptor [Armatimonadota bacterium]
MRFLTANCCLLLATMAASATWAEELNFTEQSNLAAAERGQAGAESAARSDPQGDRAADSEEGREEIPEIEVEVIGKKWGEQSVPSLAPSTAEVISVMAAEEVEAVGETTLADTIQFLPGVQVVRQGRKFERLVFVRGTFVPTVLLDGAQISAATTGFVSGFANRALYSIPLSAVERIEVIRSSSSMIYGPQALTGGVINIVTKSGEGPGHFELNTEAGDYDNWRHSVGAFEGTEDRGTAVVAERATGESNLEWGFRRMNHLFCKFNRNLDNDDTVKLLFLSNEGRRQIDMWSEEFQQITGRGPVYWTFDPWRERFTSLAYAHNLATPGAGIDLLLWARNRFFHQPYYDGPIAPKPKATVYSDTKDDTVGVSLFWRQPMSREHYLRMGVQWFQLNGYDQDAILDPGTGRVVEQPPVSTDSKLASYIFQDEWTLSAGTRFYYGGRYETPEDRDNALVYSLGLERDLGDKAQAYARFGTGVEFPSHSQLESDPTLEDQTSKNWDVGLDRSFGPNLVGHLGWFQAAIQNDFIEYLKPGGDPTNRRHYLTAQADQTTSGVEVELQARANNLRWFANYTNLDRSVGRTPVIGGQPLQLAIPPGNIFNVGLRWSLHGGRTKISPTYKYVSSYLAGARYFAGAWPIDSYQVTNVSVSREVGKGWSFTAALNNIFDQEYETQPGYPMPGRNYLVGLSRTVGSE